MRKLFLLTVFFTASPILILVTIMFTLSLSYQNPQKYHPFTLFTSKGVSYAALPTIRDSFISEIFQKDTKIEIIRQFFAKYKSPLEPYAADIVSEAEANGLDFRLLPAIAMQESNLCNKIPEGSNNCWGFGIYGGKVRKFNDYPEAIRIVSKTLAKEYKNKGLDTPVKIMSKYTPSSNGSWARGVNHFMDKLQ